MKKIEFIKLAIKDHKVGALAASSKYTARRIVKLLEPEHKFIIEYGAGGGIITKKILKRLPSDGKLKALELNKGFIPELQKISDHRLEIINEDVAIFSQKLSKLGLPRIDAVISGIPFSFLKPGQRQEVIKNTYNSLATGGIFLIYQHSPLVLPILKKYFTIIECKFEPRNFLPYFIMRAKK
jgi:phospholipid N-methyltransferase